MAIHIIYLSNGFGKKKKKACMSGICSANSYQMCFFDIGLVIWFGAFLGIYHSNLRVS